MLIWFCRPQFLEVPVRKRELDPKFFKAYSFLRFIGPARLDRRVQMVLSHSWLSRLWCRWMSFRNLESRPFFPLTNSE